MVQIPDFQVQGRGIQLSRQQTVTPQEIQAETQALRGVSDVFLQAEAREQETKAANDFTQFMLDSQESIKQAQIEKQNDPEGFTDFVLNKQSELKDIYLRDNQGKFYQDVFNSRFNSYLPSVQNSSINFEAKQKTAVQVQRLNDAMEKSIALAFDNPDMLPQVISQVEGNMALAQETALIPNAQEELRAFKEKAHATIAEKYINEERLGAANQFIDENQGTLGDSLPKLRNAITSKRKALAKEAEQRQYMAKLLGGDKLADPSSKVDRKIIDKNFIESGVAEAFAKGDLGAAKESVGIVANTGIIPESMQSSLRGMMVNGDENQQAFAYGVIAEIEETKPTALKGAAGFSDAEVEEAVAYNSYVRSGMSSELAVQQVISARNPIDEPVRKMRSEQANKLAAKIDYATVQNTFDSIFTLEPKLANQNLKDVATADARNLYKQGYIKYGDEQLAKDFMKSQLKNKYQETAVGGNRRIMPYAPESFYSINGFDHKVNTKWMNEQLSDAVKEVGKEAEEIVIVPSFDAKGMVDNGLPPSYYVFSGDDIILGENNKPMQFMFDQEDGLKRINSDVKKERKKKMKEGLFKRGVYQTIEDATPNEIQQFLLKRGFDIVNALGELPDETKPKRDINAEAQKKVNDAKGKLIGLD